MIQIKICGITNMEDAQCAAANSAAAVGFIFYAPSLRYIQPRKARVIIDALPRDLVKVGVFVNQTAEEVTRIFDYCGLDMIQLHGDESPDYCLQFPAGGIIKAMELKTEEDVETSTLYDVAAILVDSRHAGLYGGTGKTSNWDLAKRIARPLILSGGLNENNVSEALHKVKPAALDINSGLENAPGKKDPVKIGRMMQIIRDESQGIATPQIFIRRETT